MSPKDDQASDSVRMWRYATILAAIALFCTLLLGGLSAWFLGAVALVGLTSAALTFNFHIPGALVRLFAIGRTAARYGERLAGHKAALTDQCNHRVRLFSILASSPTIRAASWQLSDDARLTDFLEDVEDIDYARLRVRLPKIALGLGIAACTLATTWIAPAALLTIVPLLGLLFVGQHNLRHVTGDNWTRARSRRRSGARHFGSVISAATALMAEKRWRPELTGAADMLSDAEKWTLTVHHQQIKLEAFTSLVGPLAAASVLGAALLAGARAEALLPAFFVSFCWFSLSETLQGISRVSVASMRHAAAASAMAEEYGCGRTPSPASTSAVAMIKTLSHRALQRHAPDGRRLGLPVDLRFEIGRPVVFAGVSGVGKTSLLKQIAGWIGEEVFESNAGPLSAPTRSSLCWFGLHDAAVLSDTVRANLFSAETCNDDLWEALVAVELTDRVREIGGLDGWITQDVLSLGEVHRFGLARAWLTSKPIVVLDEPTEHLNRPMAERIMARLLARLSDRLVIISSHHATELSCFGECRVNTLDTGNG